MASSSSSSRRPSFEADDGLASIAGDPFPQRHPFVSRTGFCNTPASTMTPRRRGSLRKLASLSSYSSVSSSPRSMVPGRIFDTRFEEALINPPHFLDSCNLCKKPLGSRDIFMYRGDVPFCSEECRAEQIETDEAMEKSRSLSASMKAMRTKQNEQNSSSSSSPAKSQKYPFRAGIAAA